MGSKCSSLGLKGVIIPSKRDDTRTVHITSKNQKRGSINSGKFARPEDRTADTVRTPENPLGTATRPRSIPAELTAPETTGNHDNLNDTYPIMSPTHADTPQFKKLFQYKKGPLLGEGPSGKVLECLNLNTGELLAVKSFRIPGDPLRVSSYMDSLRKEISIARSLGHRNIVKYFTCDLSEENGKDAPMADIVLEYVSGGSVRKLLDKFHRLEEKVIGTYIRQVIEGLAYLHLNDIVHRNLKGSNILIDTTGTIKLTDFVRSGRNDRVSEENPQDHHRSSSKNSIFWSAPEVIMRKSQGKPADIWSVGCVIIEMLTGKHPWYRQHNDIEDFTRKISSGEHPPLPEGISDACRDFLLKTFKFDPEERPTPLRLLDHAFLREENQETSYLEAESVNTYGTFQSGQKNIDIPSDGNGNLKESTRADRKYLDLKSNNFTRKQIGTNVSMSNINLGKITTTDFAQQNPYNAPFEPRSSIGQNLHRVREVHYEDEQSPEPDFQNQFYKFGKMSQKLAEKNSQQHQEEHLTKEEKRRRLEAEMANELLKVSTGYLGNADDGEEDGEGTNVYNIENAEQGRNEIYKKSIMPAPIKNSLFAEDEYPKKPAHEMMYSAVNMNISEYKPPPIGQSGNLGYTGMMWNSQHFELKASALSKYNDSQPEDKSSEGYDPILGRKSTHSMQNSENDTAKKERLRRQFEENMEASLRRVRAEDRDSMQNSETDTAKKERLRRQYEEQMEMSLQRVRPEDRDSMQNSETDTAKKERLRRQFEENMEASLRRVSPDRQGSGQYSETDTAKKERLRRQFEENMEVSLQRVDSERYYREERSENSDNGDRMRGSLSRKQPQEEMTVSQVLPRFSTEMRDTYKNEEAGYYIERLQGKKFEEDVIGFKGVWDGAHEGMHTILRRDTPNLFDGDRRSPENYPEPYLPRYNPEDSKSTQEPFSGVVGQRASPDNLLDFEHGREQDLDIENQEKLGIINEAEELKEETYRSKRPNSRDSRENW